MTRDRRTRTRHQRDHIISQPMTRPRVGAHLNHLAVAVVAATLAAACASGGDTDSATGATHVGASPTTSTTAAELKATPAAAAHTDSDVPRSSPSPESRSSPPVVWVEGGEMSGGVGASGGDGFVSVDLSTWHGCALRASGEVECWGRNEFGQASAPSGLFRAVHVGDAFSCGLGVDGAAVCWGEPEIVGWTPDSRFVDLDVGGSWACGVRADGGSECWSGGSPDPVWVSGAVDRVLVEPWTRCAFFRAGGAECVGVVGLETAAASDARSISGSFGHACWSGRAPARMGPAVCARWDGADEYGQAMPPSGDFDVIDVSYSFSCGLRSDGRVECWGAEHESPCFGGGRCVGLGCVSGSAGTVCGVERQPGHRGHRVGLRDP